MRLAGIINDNEDYKEIPGRTAPVEPTPQEAPPSEAPPAQGPETPAETPGPNGSPQSDQGGPPPQTPQTPPVTGQGAGLEASTATGGLEGTFAQVGNSNFAQRFGGTNPAVWFRNFGQSQRNDAANAGRGNAGGNGNSGGAIPSEGPVGGPSTGAEGGGKSDEEWQRFMREVQRLRFGQGGA